MLELTAGRRGGLRKHSFLTATCLLTGAAAFTAHAAEPPVHWSANSAPSETMISGGPWTLEQSGAADGLKSSGYCDSSGNQVPNPGIERMEPYYFPFVVGSGRNLQGYFDYRPKDTDEAVVAAASHDGGHTWEFQQEVLQLRTTCPNQLNKEPDGSKDNNAFNLANNSDNGDDDGQGHQFVITIGGHTYLYTLDRANNAAPSGRVIMRIIRSAPLPTTTLHICASRRPLMASTSPTRARCRG